MLCVANLARTPQAVELELSEFAGRVPIELDGGSVFPPIGQLTYLLTLPPYGFYWFLLADEEAGWPSLHTPAPEADARISNDRPAQSPGRCAAGRTRRSWSARSCRPTWPSAAGSR